MRFAELSAGSDSRWMNKRYNRAEIIDRTRRSPVWLHFGAGNIFRAFMARVADELLEKGVLDRGIIVAEGYDYEIIDKAYREYNNYSIVSTIRDSGEIDNRIIGSITESLRLDREQYPVDYSRLREIMQSDSLQIVSFTITEKGYLIRSEECREDYINGPDRAVSYGGKIAALAYERYVSGRKKIAYVSMDNCSGNGDRLRELLITYAREWEKNKVVESGFAEYLLDERYVTFPWSMIDKITPRPDDNIKKIIMSEGIEGIDGIVTSKGTFVAPYVNAEETEYLVIEDHFPNGRPDFADKVYFTDRQTVSNTERMKVCTCLNPLHTALAVYGCLFKYETIHEEMNDRDLVELIKHIGYMEGLPVVITPKIIDPKRFIDEVIEKRLPNKYIPDSPNRIATDTSMKLKIRYGETLKSQRKNGTNKDHTGIALVFAGWLRYLMAVDDDHRPMELSGDPGIKKVRKLLSEGRINKVLADEDIWGVDLYEYGMAEEVLTLYEQMKDRGMVRETLHKKVGEFSW